MRGAIGGMPVLAALATCDIILYGSLLGNLGVGVLVYCRGLVDSRLPFYMNKLS